MASRALGYDLITREPITVGPIGDGVSDDYPVLQDLWNRTGVFSLSPGQYFLSRPLKGPKVENVGIIGAGGGIAETTFGPNSGTIFFGGFASDTVIQVPDSTMHAQFVGFAVSRTIQATDGYGLDMGKSCDAAYLYDLWFLRQGVGFRLGTTGYSKAEFIRTEQNLKDGAHITGTWQLENIFSAINGGAGFLCTAQEPDGNALGQYKGLSTYGNRGHGIAFLGKVLEIRLMDSFFGSDGDVEVYVGNDNMGGHNSFTHVMTEDSGGTAGWVFTESSSSNGLAACSCRGGNPHGIVNSAPYFSMVGGGCYNAKEYGILNLAGRVSVIGSRLTNNKTGIGCAIGTKGITAIGNDMRGTITPLDVSLVPEGQRFIGGNFTI